MANTNTKVALYRNNAPPVRQIIQIINLSNGKYLFNQNNFYLYITEDFLIAIP